jgi:glucokinase
VLFAFNNAARYAIGGDLELPELNLTLCELDGSAIISENSTLTKTDIAEPEKALSVVKRKTEEMLRKAGKDLNQVIGMGLGVPAFLKGNEITISGRNLPQWKHVPVQSMLEEQLHIPIVMDRDVNFMALAENHFMGYQDRVMSYIALRKGVGNDVRMGGSTLLDGKVFHGGCGNASSLQHAYVEVDDIAQRSQEAASSAQAAEELASLIASSLIEPIKQMVTFFDPNRLVINAKILDSAETAFINQIDTQLSTELGSEFDWEIEVRQAQDQSFSCAKGGALFVLQRLFSRSDELMKELVASPS